MRPYSSFNNPVEDHYVSALDCCRSLAREAEEWLQMRAQMRFEEKQALARLRATAFKKAGVAR